jgi:hypothetical protein
MHMRHLLLRFGGEAGGKALHTQGHGETTLNDPSVTHRGKTPAGHKAIYVATPEELRSLPHPP